MGGRAVVTPANPPDEGGLEKLAEFLRRAVRPVPDRPTALRHRRLRGVAPSASCSRGSSHSALSFRGSPSRVPDSCGRWPVSRMSSTGRWRQAAILPS